MTPECITRRLIAILSADVKDYTRLMSQDDVGTIRTLSAYKEEIMASSKRVTSLFFLFLLVTTFTGVGAALPLQGAEAAKGASSAADEIRIGYTVQVTGAAASEGALGLRAIKLALKQINEAGGVEGRKIHLLIEDTQSSNPGALAALQKCRSISGSLLCAQKEQSSCHHISP
jgi:hypothetical protein